MEIGRHQRCERMVHRDLLSRSDTHRQKGRQQDCAVVCPLLNLWVGFPVDYNVTSSRSGGSTGGSKCSRTVEPRQAKACFTYPEEIPP